MNNSCQECGKVLSDIEMRNHPFVYCEMAKAFPTKWREYIKQIEQFVKSKQDGENNGSK